MDEGFGTCGTGGLPHALALIGTRCTLRRQKMAVMSAMRVLHLIPAVAPRYGGPSTAIWPMVAALRERGLEVEVATTDADGGERRLTKADLPQGGDGVHLFRYEYGETLKYSPQLGRWLASHARDYDVIQTHSNWNYPVAAACLAA